MLADAVEPEYAFNGDAWAGYFGVYHLDEATGDAYDSSPAGNDLIQVLNQLPSSAAGLIRGARHTNKNSWQGFEKMPINGGSTAGQFTVSGWMSNDNDLQD